MKYVSKIGYLILFILLATTKVFAEGITSLEEMAKRELRVSNEQNKPRISKASKIATVSVAQDKENLSLEKNKSFVISFTKMDLGGYILGSEEVSAESSKVNMASFKLAKQYSNIYKYFGQFGYGIWQGRSDVLSDSEKVNLNFLSIGLGFEHTVYSARWLELSYSLFVNSQSLVQVSETGLLNGDQQFLNGGLSANMRSASFFEDSAKLYFSYVSQRKIEVELLEIPANSIEIGLEVLW